MNVGSRRSWGYTYFGLLLALALASIAVGSGAHLLAQDMRRDKEADLMFAGDQIRRAIEQYHTLNSATPKPYPLEMTALLRDPGQPGLVRHLRRIYPDPMSRDGEWVIIRSQGNGIVGVHSASREAPLKKTGFATHYSNFERARNYADWQFIAQGAVPLGNPANAENPGPGEPTGGEERPPSQPLRPAPLRPAGAPAIPSR